MPVSQATLDLINKAEDGLASATAADANAANLLAAAQVADQAATDGKNSALAAHATATQQANDAINALKAELGIPITTPSAKVRSLVSVATHPTIQKALAANLTWQQILGALLQGGLAFLENLIEQQGKS